MYLQNCIKTILLRENFLQQIKIVVKLWKVWTISQPFCFLLWHRPSNFPPYWVCVDWWPCLAVSSLHCNDAGVSSLLFSDFLWLFHSFFFIQPNDPKSRNAYDAKRKTKRGWPNHRRKLVLQPYYYQLTKLPLSSPLSLFWHLQMSVWNFTPITNILISNILDWREKSQSLLIQLL